MKVTISYEFATEQEAAEWSADVLRGQRPKAAPPNVVTGAGPYTPPAAAPVAAPPPMAAPVAAPPPMAAAPAAPPPPAAPAAPPAAPTDATAAAVFNAMKEWMTRRGYQTATEAKAVMAQAHVPADPATGQLLLAQATPDQLRWLLATFQAP